MNTIHLEDKNWRRRRGVFVETGQKMRWITYTTLVWQQLHVQLSKFGCLNTKSFCLDNKPSHLNLKLLLYNRLELRRLRPQTRLRGTNDRYTITRPQFLDRNVSHTVNLISIGSTRQFSLQSQIWIEFRIGQKIVLISLLQSSYICFLEKKSASYFKKIIT